MDERGVCPFVVEVPAYRIEDGVIFITAGEFCMCMALRTFEAGHAISGKLIAEYRARRAEVVEFRQEFPRSA